MLLIGIIAPAGYCLWLIATGRIQSPTGRQASARPDAANER